MKRILIVEDNKDLAFGLQSNLEIEGYGVRCATNGPEGLKLARSWRPDLLILDLMLPQMDGFAVLKNLRSFDADMPVLFLTARGEEVDKVRGLRMGADDYVTKPFGLMELLARVEAIIRRNRRGRSYDHLTDHAPIQFRDIKICQKTRTVFKSGNSVDLAPKEFELLVELVNRQGAVVSRIDLMKSVWGHSSTVVSRTVDTHIGELRRKLEDDSANPSIIITVRKVGYRLDSRSNE